jgi:hypothetical protein
MRRPWTSGSNSLTRTGNVGSSVPVSRLRMQTVAAVFLNWTISDDLTRLAAFADDGVGERPALRVHQGRSRRRNIVECMGFSSQTGTWKNRCERQQWWLRSGAVLAYSEHRRPPVQRAAGFSSVPNVASWQKWEYRGGCTRGERVHLR